MYSFANDPPFSSWFFVTLDTAGQAPLLDNAALCTRLERAWAVQMRGPAPCYSAEFAFSARALHALVRVQPPAHDAESLLGGMLSRFVAEHGAEALWTTQPRMRRLRNAEELRGLRDFIVQKMLGGEEVGAG